MHLSEEVKTQQVKNALGFLSRSLHKYFDKKDWILIDEHDSPINVACKGFVPTGENPNVFTDCLEQVLTLFRGLIGAAFETNNYLDKGLITGMLRIAKADMLPAVNTLVEHNILSKVMLCNHATMALHY